MFVIVSYIYFTPTTWLRLNSKYTYVSVRRMAYCVVLYAKVQSLYVAPACESNSLCPARLVHLACIHNRNLPPGNYCCWTSKQIPPFFIPFQNTIEKIFPWTKTKVWKQLSVWNGWVCKNWFFGACIQEMFNC